MKKLAIDIALRLSFSEWIRQAFPISIAFIYCCKIVLTVGGMVSKATNIACCETQM